jgi:hypothetical protein
VNDQWQAEQTDAFSGWFEQYRMQTWLSAGCGKERGPGPSASWALGYRDQLLRGWLAHAALSQAPAQEALEALRADLAKMTEQRDHLHNAIHSERDRMDEYVGRLIAERDAAREDARRYRWLRDEAVWRGEPDGTGNMVWCVIGPDAYNLTPVDGKDLDELVDIRLAAIDSAMTQEGEGEQT